MPNSPEQIEVYGQKHPIRKILILLFILSGVLSLWHIDHNKTGITGFFIAQNMQEFTIDLRETYNQTTEYVLPLDYTKDFYLTGLTISGVFIGDTGSYFRVYLEDLTGKRFFVTGSESAQKNLLGITGRFATELNETTNTTVLQYNITQNNSIKLKYYDKSKFDPENDGIEAPNGVIDFTVEDSDIPNTTNICTLWKINSLETSSITNTCAGQCCEQLGIEAFSQEWKTPFATHIGKDNTTKNNEVYAKIVGFTNDTIPQIIQTQWDHLPARFIDSYIAFSQACTETCLLPAGITGPELKLVLEISEGELVVNLVEGTIKEYEKNKTNLAYNKIKEDPRYDVIIDNVQKDGRDLLVKGHHTQLQGNLTVRVIGKVNYSIINVQAAGYEEFVVRIPNYKNEYFKIKVGDQTEEFAFGIPKTVAVEAVVSASNGSDLPVEVAVIDETINEQIISAQGPRPGVQIKEGTYKLTLEPENHPIKKIEMPIEIYANETIQLGMEEVPTERVTINSENVIETYALDTSQLPSNATVTVTATGKELWKCKTWIFKKQECPEGWEKIRDVEPGKDYTIELNPTDPAFSETVQPNDGKTTYIDEDDNDNYGSTNKLRVKAGSGEQRKALLEFNISNIPNNAKILDAQLEITKKSGGSQTVTVKRITESWTENGATWEKKDGATNWASEGGSYASTIYATTNVGSGSDEPYQWNITKLLQEWVNGTNANYGVILTGDSSSNTEFYSDDETTVTKRPRLILNYSTPLVVQIVNPAGSTVFNSSSFYVNITANGNISSAVLEINGTNLTMTGSLSRYFASVNLANGTYNLKAFATDAQTGEVYSTQTINVTVSITLTSTPNVTITDNSSTPRKNDTVRFVINAEDASNLSNATFSWNGTGVWTNETYSVNGSAGQITLNKQITLSKNSAIGYYAVVMNKQGASNQSNLKLISVKDTSPNKPQIVTPTNGTRLNQNSVLIVWTNVTDVDEDVVSYVIEITNSTITRMASTTNNSQPTMLADGENKFRVLSSTSDANSSFSETVTLILDQIPPSLNVTGLQNNTFTNQNTISVQVIQSETGTLNLIINNLLNISTTNLSSTFLILLNEGSNTITFTTNDSAGNTNNVTFLINLDTVLPQINITKIRNHSRDVIVEGKTFDLNQETLTANDSQFTITQIEQNWTILNNTEISEKTYSVQLRLNDTAGNIANVAVNFTIDRSAPNISLSGITQNQITNQTSIPMLVQLSEQANTIIKLNGNLILSSSNSTTYFNITVTGGNQTLEVNSSDLASNNQVIFVGFVVDNSKPNISLNNYSYVQSNVRLSGATEDSNPDKITVNDSRFSIQGTYYTWNITNSTGLTDGDYQLFITANDSAGNRHKIQVNISVDQTPPAVNITGIINNSILGSKNISVFVNASESAIINVTIGGNSLIVDTTALINLTLNEGNNTITITADDRVQNTNRVIYTVELDTIDPQIIVEGLTNGTITNRSEFTLKVNQSEQANFTFKIDTAAFISTSNISSTIKFLLTEGTHNLTFISKDKVNNSESFDYILQIDMTAPNLTVNAQSAPMRVINITGTTIDINVDQTSSNDSRFAVNKDGVKWMLTNNTAIVDGSYSVLITANDTAGNAASISVNLTKDTIAPFVNITTNQRVFNTLIVTGTSADTHISNIMTNDSRFKMSGINQWTLVNNTNLNDGNYAVLVSVNDTAGNIANVAVNFTIDRSPPNITVVGIQNNLVTNNQTFIMNTTNSEEGTTQLTLNQLLNITSSNNSNVFTITLNEGNNTIQYTANDTAGNHIDLNYTVRIDTSPPILNVAGIKNSTIAYTKLNISVNVSEPARTKTYLNTTLLNETQNQTSTQNIELNEGKQTILIETTDTAGNTAQQNYLINVDTIKPQINITKINRLTSKILIEGLAEDENTDTIKLNDTRFTLQGLQNWSITNNTNLNDGNYTIIISLNDTAGNQNTVQLNFTYDQTPPKILTVGPLNNTESYRNFTIFNQELSDDISGVKNCTLNATERSGQASFYNIQNGNQRISLNSGNYTWFVECSDNAGNSNKTKESQLRVTIVELYGEVFTNKSNITNIDPLNVTGLFVEKANIGKVEYKKNLSFKRTVNLSQAIKIEKGEITINSSEYPELNSSAILTIHGINYLIPVIVRDNEECKSSECTLIQAGGGTLIFEVTHFSTYSVKESNSVLAAVGHRPPTIKGVSPAEVPEYKIQVELPCKENWNCTTWSNCKKNVQTRKCSDLNKCGTEEHLPILEQACYQPVCSGNWTCTEWESCSKGNKTRTCTDQNNCSNNDMPEIVKSCKTPQLTSDAIREAVRSTPDKWFIPFTLLLLVILIAAEILTRKKIRPAPINRRKKRINRRRKRKRKKRRSKT